MAGKLQKVSESACFGGVQGVYTFASDTCACDMTFGLYLPPQAKDGSVPVLWYLSGLTCTHENAMVKAGAQGWAARHGLALVFPDTSPRGQEVADDAAYDLGQGAGFYVDATQDPWAAHYRMETHVARELPDVVAAHFPLDMDRQGITGHSMGGHGALTLALRNPGRYRSVSAFAPITAPGRVAWGQKALRAYLGGDETAWRAHDTVALIEDGHRLDEILVDQGTADQFLDSGLKPELLAEACRKAGIPLTLTLREGYDHSYFFVATFMEAHVAWAAGRLKA
ncbi:S-formylglutathione hydrolase [Futiania mangrovi]|uniref:S-formylglutathione hydrolase n=1 Tax=Futiania mangrovi TaxID=2959716 RepID=A0A9J6PBT6_9PROT|nr:S-formylglutathione hydrolase [Futiania mangrovii]MCP1335216.1 S-formylglutathione hydrolase [Futiania mangrovii]